MKLHHIGIACNNVKEEIERYKNTHQLNQASKIVFDDQQDAQVGLVKLENDVHIEFVSGKQVENIKRKGISYYHLCYEVDDIDQALKELVDQGALMVSEPKPAKLFDMKRVAFLQLSYGLIELLER